MHLKKGISIRTSEKKYFTWHLENHRRKEQNWSRIRVRKSMVQIRGSGSGSVSKCHRSGTLAWSVSLAQMYSYSKTLASTVGITNIQVACKRSSLWNLNIWKNDRLWHVLITWTCLGGGCFDPGGQESPGACTADWDSLQVRQNRRQIRHYSRKGRDQIGGLLRHQQLLSTTVVNQLDAVPVKPIYESVLQAGMTISDLYVIHSEGSGSGSAEEPKFVNFFRSPGIDSQPGGPVRQHYLTYRPTRLHRLAESISLNRFLGSFVYKYGLWSVPALPGTRSVSCANYYKDFCSGMNFMIEVLEQSRPISTVNRQYWT